MPNTSQDKNAIQDPFFNKTRLIILAIVLLAAMGFLIAVMITIPRRGSEAELENSDNKLANAVKDLEANLARHAHPLGSSILYISAEELVCEDFQGKQIFAYPLSMQHPVVQHIGKYAICGDRLGKQVLLLDERGKVFETQLDYSFVTADISKDGNCLFIDQQAEENAKVHLTDAEGKRILSLSFAKSGHPVAAKFTPDGKFMDILLINTRSAQLKALLRRYDLQGALSGQKVTEGYNSFFYALEHDAQNKAIIYSPTQILKMDFSQEEPLLQREFSSIQYAICYDADILLLGNSQNDAYYALYKIDKQGEITELLPQIGVVEHLRKSRDGQEFYFCQNNLFYTYDLKNNELRGPLALDGEILSYHVLENGNVNLLTQNGARIFSKP